jgi:hypothetical protein
MRSTPSLREDLPALRGLSAEVALPIVDDLAQRVDSLGVLRAGLRLAVEGVEPSAATPDGGLRGP